jgi:hypothetical protein
LLAAGDSPGYDRVSATRRKTIALEPRRRNS